MKKLKSLFLCSIVACSITSSHILFAPDMGVNTSESFLKTVKSGWSFKKMLATVLIASVVQMALGTIIEIIYCKLNKEYFEKKQLEDLIHANQMLKEQLDYIEENCFDRKAIKKAKKEYLQSCVKIMQLQKEFLDKYGKKVG
ncbi:hypothetical protein ACFLYA_01255 [Candidatus Dependentiae bacterium]